ncbi:MAG: hypothetical protein IJA63_07505 [Akkermansia sp.]|nr:hypothetical protein [Akkermansia sp.]
MAKHPELSKETLAELLQCVTNDEDEREALQALPMLSLEIIFFALYSLEQKRKDLFHCVASAYGTLSMDEFREAFLPLVREEIFCQDFLGVWHLNAKVPAKVLRKWAKKEPIFQNLLHRVKNLGVCIMQNKPLNETIPTKASFILRILRLSGHDLAAWKIMEELAIREPHKLGFKASSIINMAYKVDYFQRLVDEALTTIPQELEGIKNKLIPSVYRYNALTQLPTLLTDDELEVRTPTVRNEQDDYSDVLMHIALQTGKWYLFDSCAAVKNTQYSHNINHSYRITTEYYATTDVKAVVQALKNWRSGKWNALKELKHDLLYTKKYQNLNLSESEISFVALLAPLLCIMCIKYGKNITKDHEMAYEYLRRFNPPSARGFLSNTNCALTLDVTDYSAEYWYNSTPIELLPKALYLSKQVHLPNLGENEIPEMYEACLSLHNSGLTLYSWYMANALLTLPNLSDKQTQQLEAIILSRTDLPPFCEIEKKVSMYDTMLNCMEKLLTGNSNNTENNRAGYLAWRLKYNKKNASVSEISLYVYKKLKSGKYSKAKKLFFESSLLSDYDNYFSEADKKLLVGIQSNRAYLDWSSAKITPKTAEQLCNKDIHVELELSGEQILPIKLIKQPQALILNENKGKLKLKLPTNKSRAGIPIKKIDETQYAIEASNPRADKLIELLDDYTNGKNEIEIPIQYRDRLMNVLSCYGDAFTLGGALQTHKLQELKATPKAIALLENNKGMLHGKLVLELHPELPPVQFYNREKSYYSHLNGSAIRILRSPQDEQKLQKELEGCCPTLFEHLDGDGTWQIGVSDAMLSMIEEMQLCNPELLETRWIEGQALNISKLDSFSTFNISSAKSENQWLTIGGEVQVNESMVLQISELLQHVNKSTGHYIKLEDGHFLKLHKNIEENLRTLSALANISGKGKRTKKTVELSPALMLLMAQSNSTETLPQSLRNTAEEILQKYNVTTYRPRNLNATLRDYQTEGYQWMQSLLNCGLGACLADDMGLGKTLQMLSVLQARSKDGASLVIAPASVCNNWVSEAAKFTPTLNVHPLENGDRAQLVKSLGKRDVLVCSYGLLVTEAELLTSRKWNVVVLDEAQYIKNSQTQRAKTACELKSACRIAATGTPIENSLEELWSIFDFLNPGFLGSQEQFRERFVNTPSRRKLLRKIVAPFVKRRLKSDVLDELPEKTEITRLITLDEKERALYEACRRDALTKAQDSEDRFTILAQLMRMRRLCCHPQLVEEKWSGSTGKLNALTELAEELKEAGHKALIFSQFTDMLALVRRQFEQLGYSYLYLDGSTPKAKRGKLVDAFQDGEADFFLISLKAGGTGLNLTAADYVILLDPWWNPAVEDQAADRTHRIGQKRPVTVCRLVCKDTIEERVLALHAEKRELFDQVINDKAKAAPLSISELRDLM